MDNQVSGVLCSPVSPYNYIFHSLVTSVNRLYRHEQLLWALLNHCVKAELMVQKELLDSVRTSSLWKKWDLLFTGRCLKKRTAQYLSCALGTGIWAIGTGPFGNLCFAFRQKTFAQVFFKQRGLHTVWMVKVSDVFWCLCFFMVNTHTMWIIFVNDQSGEEALLKCFLEKLLKCFLSFSYFWIYAILWTSWIVVEKAGHVFMQIIP